jgi:preprotein translocase subunit SecA
MTQTPIQADLATWHTLRTRRRKVEMARGMDAVAQRYRARIKHGRRNLAFLRKQAEAVVAESPQWESLTDEQLDERIADVHEVFARRRYDDAQVRAAACCVREVARREKGEHPYMVQMMGALGLFYGQIVQMVTGEGKTLVGACAASMLGFLRRPVHVITVNDYLAERDADLQQPIYRRCGLRAGFVTGELQEPDRLKAYRTPIVYLTQKEVVADWLRDQLRLGRIADPVSLRWTMSRGGRPPNVLIPGLFTAIVDEIDAVLIDEAVTPLIIAQPREEDAQKDLYERARDLAGELDPKRDFTVEQRKRRVRLTNRGREHLEQLLKPDEHAIWRASRRREELVEQALVAEHCYQEGQHYQVVEEQIMIVDEYSGRFMQDRQWQHGLHQAAEAKHHLPVTADRDTLASLSFQRFFRMYPHLCGMTGTAADARPEMEATYGLPVRIIPTNRPIARTQLPNLIFARSQDRWEAVVSDITDMHTQGRATLVGTRSVEASEHLSNMLKEHGLEHQVLNAVHHKAEADIIAEAGKPGAITVATNMAGRGTDIKLATGVREVGGLHVILTERHTARRVDRQLFGRAGRQGDPGSARCIISLEDDLVLKFAPHVSSLLRKRYRSRRGPLPAWTVAAFDAAQRRAQRAAFKSRAGVLRHDEELDRTLPT